MAELFLVTGGSRSGKSSFALQTATSYQDPRTFIATCPVLDEEMAQRVERHQCERQGKGWHTIEETINLAQTVDTVGRGTILIDCLTLWMNNLMYDAEQQDTTFNEEDAETASRQLVEALERFQGRAVVVTTEVGFGITPEHELARRFRDNAGRCNQVLAAAASHAVCMVSGLPMVLKENGTVPSHSANFF